MKKNQRFLPFFALLTASAALIMTIAANGQQSSIGFYLQITDTLPPAVTLIEPLNNSGSQSFNVTFSYNVSDSSSVSSCSLSINKKINSTNSTISKNTKIYFKVNYFLFGVYNWSINCTDSLNNSGLSSENAITVHTLTNFNGSTTNLSLFDNRGVTNFVLESLPYGKINFSESIDLSIGYDFDKYVNISYNKIALNSDMLGILNKSAILSLYGLSFSNPGILKDGEACPGSICTKISYSEGTLKFSVTQFSAYSAQENPSTSSESESTGLGGGGGTRIINRSKGNEKPKQSKTVSTDFTIDKSSMRIVLRQGQSAEESLNIKNIGTAEFDIKAILSELEKFKAYPEGAEFTTSLKPGEEKSIKIVFRASENEIPEIYPGRIFIKGPSQQKEVITVVEVDSAQALFDVAVNVIPESKRVLPGEEVRLDVTLVNIRGFGRVDVNVEYFIKDLLGNVVSTEHETLAVETQAKFTRAILAPSDLLPGTYVAFVKATYGDSVGVGSDLFDINAKTLSLFPIIQPKNYIYLFLVAAIAVAIFASVGYAIARSRKNLPKTELMQVRQIISDKKDEKLTKELGALEKAFRANYISEESYQKSRKRIEQKLRKT